MLQKDFSKYKHLTKDEIQFFADNGYLLLKSIIPLHECQHYDKKYIQPALQRLADLNEANPSTWFLQNNSKLHEFVTQNPLSYQKVPVEGGREEEHDNGQDGIPIGLMVRDASNSDDLNPISTDQGGNWNALFGSERLNGILDELHCTAIPPTRNRDHGNMNKEDIQESQPRTHRQEQRWEYLHPNNVGWIHVRLPISYDDQFKKYQENNHSNKHPHEEDFHIPYNEQTWHVDGGHFSPHYLSSLDQSVILLPMIRDIQSNGSGNTVLLSGSHIDIARQLKSHDESEKGNHGGGIDKSQLNSYCEQVSKTWPKEQIVEVAPCNAGDVLIIHPFLIHSAGWNTRNITLDSRLKQPQTEHHDVNQNDDSNKGIDCFRLTFNIGTRWRNASFEGNSKGGVTSLMFDAENVDQMSILEWTICKSLLN